MLQIFPSNLVYMIRILHGSMTDSCVCVCSSRVGPNFDQSFPSQLKSKTTPSVYDKI